MFRVLRVWRARRKLNRGTGDLGPALDTTKKKDDIERLVQSAVANPGPGIVK
jgi:hypothetical protein